MREVVIRWGYAGHRLAHFTAKKLGLINKTPAAKRNLDGIQAQMINFVERPLPSLPAAH